MFLCKWVFKHGSPPGFWTLESESFNDKSPEVCLLSTNMDCVYQYKILGWDLAIARFSLGPAGSWGLRPTWLIHSFILLFFPLVTKVFHLVTKVFPLVTKVFPLVTKVLPLIIKIYAPLLIPLLWNDNQQTYSFVNCYTKTKNEKWLQTMIQTYSVLSQILD